jgi:hypothetical protein
MVAADQIPPRRPVELGLAGGEVRAQYERLDHPGFGALPPDLSGYALQRLMLHAEWRIGPRLRAFGQLASALGVANTPAKRLVMPIVNRG